MCRREINKCKTIAKDGEFAKRGREAVGTRSIQECLLLFYIRSTSDCNLNQRLPVFIS